MKTLFGNKTGKKATSLLLTVIFLLSLAMPAAASISPANLTVTLAPGQSVNEVKTVEIPPVTPKVDVVFAFDSTYSMQQIIDRSRVKVSEIMNILNASGVDINYGVISYMDYPHVYDSYGYKRDFGSPGDYAYRLNQPVTSDVEAVSNAVKNITLSDGGDSPQNYSRIFYESYSDSSIGWRTGAKKILINFGDCIPHDDNLNEGVTTGIWSTGGDPGRDEVMFTQDDLDLQKVLGEMAANNVVLIQGLYMDFPAWLFGGPKDLNIIKYWDQWTGMTGGSAYIIKSETFTEDIVNVINSKLTTPNVQNLHLQAGSGYESWLYSVNPQSYNGPAGSSANFDISIKVPDGTTPGVYKFAISAVDDNNVNYGDQTVEITVPSDNNPPQLTAGETSVGEGTAAQNIGTVFDPDGDVVKLTASSGSVKNNGDGTWSWSCPTSDGPAESRTVTIFADDGQGGMSSIAFNLEVKNLPPKLGVISADTYLVPVGTQVNFNANFTDPGVLDTHTACWNFGDGSNGAGIDSETGGSGIVNNRHAYTTPGIYTVQLTVTDKDGASDIGLLEQYVVVYDPGAGFVTGGGWINSPAGAYTRDPYLSGRANFGFVSKYQNRAAVPIGQTEFQFKAGDLNFHSESYEWLVVAGAKAQYKGTGTINGLGEYGFMLTATDGQINGAGIDKFRIKIWDKVTGQTVYDNNIGNDDNSDPSTVLAGGNIVIHKDNN